MPDAYNSNMCHPSPTGPFNNTDVKTLERGDVRTDNGEGGKNIVLAMVLIEDVLALLLMVLICPPVNACS